ncbi:MAG: 50S ribosomal protein L24 [Planctomycetota bacterium]|jgi:large subunit ribosomal protein L24
MARHIRKGDTVVVTAGNFKGAVGEVLEVHPDFDTCLVKGVNVREKRLRPNANRPRGTTVRVEQPIHISNVSPAVEGKPTRVRFETRPDGSKVRVAVRGGGVLHTLRGPRD